VIHMDWQHEGPETRRITVVADGDEFMIDVSQDRLYRNGILICGGEDDTGGLRREYKRLLAHFRVCLKSRESLCSCDEVRLVERARALGQSVA
jgi:hypothetical protein